MNATTDTPERVEGEIDEPGTDLVERAREVLAAPQNQRPDYQLAIEMGRAMAASGYFTDARKEAEAAVKIIIGLDLGISPTAAMTAIHIVKGKPMVGYQIIAAKIIQHPHYGYTTLAHDDDHCVLAFTDDRRGTPASDPEDADEEPREANEIGRVEWTLDRAKKIGLVKSDSGWANYPRNMLIARCFSDGVKWYMPDLRTGAAVYVEDEIPDDRRSLEVGDSRPPALATPAAEASRERARKAYDELRGLNSTIMPPGVFNKMTRDAAHSQVELDNLVAHVEDLAGVEHEIQAAWEVAREALDDDVVATLEATVARKRSQRDRLAAIRAAIPGEGSGSGE
jgi:hypothetical protein